jgi:hypothetical protein
MIEARCNVKAPVNGMITIMSIGQLSPEGSWVSSQGMQDQAFRNNDGDLVAWLYSVVDP